MLAGKFLYNQILRIVGVLILIHHYELEPAADTRQGIGKIPEKNVCIQQDVIKIHCPGLPAFLCILPINLPQPWFPCCRIILDEGAVAGIGLCCNKIVFCH